MTPTKKPDAEKRNAEREAALTFVRMAKEKGLDLTGPDGLLKQFTKSVLETALDEEMTEHLGRAKHKKSKDGRAANTRNGTTAKTVVTDSVGPVGIEVPRDRDGSFEPVVVRKRQRRLPGVDEVVLSLYARGLTTGEISAHFQEIYGADVSRETVSRITERVVAEKDEWCSRPLDRVYAAVFIDATVVKVRDGQVANRAFYVAVGVDLEGGRDVLGIWASPAAEGARYWLSVLTELKNRGVDDVFFLICDGLKGLPDAVGDAAVFIDATVVKVRDGQVANRAFYVAVGVDLEGGRDVLGIWASPAAEGARYWLSVLTELKNRGVDDVFFLICDGLKGLPDAVGDAAVFIDATVVKVRDGQVANRAFYVAVGVDLEGDRDVLGIWTSPAAAAAARDAMLDKWEARYPAIRRLWMDAWKRFIPFLDYDVEIRRVICTTNAIESLNARFKRSIRARGHFPDEQAALKCMYLTVRSLDPTGKGRIRWSARWKPALNAFAITFADRWPSEGTQQ